MDTFYILVIHDWHFNTGFWRKGCILIMEKVIKFYSKVKSILHLFYLLVTFLWSLSKRWKWVDVRHTWASRVAQYPPASAGDKRGGL